MYTAADRLTSAVKDKTGPDESLQEELEIWCDDIANVMATRICGVVKGVLKEFEEDVGDQLDKQKDTVKKLGDQTINLQKKFEQFFLRCGWKEIVFWVSLGLVAASSVVSIFLILKLARLAGIVGLSLTG